MEYSSSYDKRISPRLYPWWLILVGFAFGVVATLMFTAPRWQPTVVYRYAPDDPAIWMQATMLVEQATLAANGAVFQPPLDPILATATAIVQQAETQVGAFNGAVEGDPLGDSFALTATAIVAQATQAASGSR
jgi:hypothetical protein